MADHELLICPSCATPNRVPRDRLAQTPQCGKCKAPLFLGKPLALDAAGFDRLIGMGTLPVLVDFWAEWCGPCKMMAPAFAAAAGDLEPQMRLAKVDIEAEQALAARYGIRSIPTLAIFRDGREIARQSGLMDRAALVRWAQAATYHSR